MPEQIWICELCHSKHKHYAGAEQCEARHRMLVETASIRELSWGFNTDFPDTLVVRFNDANEIFIANYKYAGCAKRLKVTKAVTDGPQEI